MEFRDNNQSAVTERETTTTQTTAENRGGRAGFKAELIVSYLVSLLLGLLAIRFVLSLLGANEANPFAAFIYRVTYPFVAPFFTLFNYETQIGVATVEVWTLVAMAVYALLGYAVARLIRIARS